MTTIRFRYRDAQGNESERNLLQWSETTMHLQGRTESDTFPKTYRKDRILEVLEGSELLLNDAAPPSPKAPPKPSAFDMAAAAAVMTTGQQRQVPGGKNQILFTGFAAAQRADLEQQAAEYGMSVMKTAGKSLTFLCYGYNAGPAKVIKAQEAGAFIIDSEQFAHLLETGELP